VNAEAFDAVEFRVPQGFGLYLKDRASGRLFRVAPVRDPAQPRLWCLRIETCTASGVVPLGSVGCLATPGVAWDDALAAIEAIRTDAGAWLAGEERRALRGWLRDRATEPPAVPVVAERLQPRRLP
jgi:hypothetical protein